MLDTDTLTTVGVGMITKQNPALIEVDIQNDFCTGGALAVRDSNKVAELSNKLARLFNQKKWRIFLSRDWHPANTKHFAESGGPWPVHCIQETEGAKFHPRLEYPATAYVLSKGTGTEDDGYSAFDGQIYGHPLAEYLRYFQIDTLFICGLATDYCVKATVLDALYKYRYPVYLVTDACKAVNINNLKDPRRSEPKIKEIISYLLRRGLDLSDENIALQEMRRAGATFTTTKNVLRMLHKSIEQNEENDDC